MDQPVPHNKKKFKNFLQLKQKSPKMFYFYLGVEIFKIFFIFSRNRYSSPLYKKNLKCFIFSRNGYSGPLYKKNIKFFIFSQNRNSSTHHKKA